MAHNLSWVTAHLELCKEATRAESFEVGSCYISGAKPCKRPLEGAPSRKGARGRSTMDGPNIRLDTVEISQAGVRHQPFHPVAQGEATSSLSRTAV